MRKVKRIIAAGCLLASLGGLLISCQREGSRPASDGSKGGVKPSSPVVLDQPSIRDIAENPKVYMSSAYTSTARIAKDENLYQWEFVRNNISAWKHSLTLVSTGGYGEAFFLKMIEYMRKNNIEMYIEARVSGERVVSVEEKGVLDAQMHMKQLQRVYDAGYEVHGIELDGAWKDYKFAGMSEEEATRCVVYYFKTLHEAWPDTKLYFLYNFPNWGWKGEPAFRSPTDDPMYMGDAYEVYRAVTTALKEAGVPLQGFVIDNPYGYLSRFPFLGDRMREFEEMCRRDGYDYHLIVNSEHGGSQADETFTHETLAMVDRYLALGGRPDVYEVQSWYANPIDYIPEQDRKTMTGATKAVIDRLLQKKILTLPRA